MKWPGRLRGAERRFSEHAPRASFAAALPAPARNNPAAD